MNNLKIILLTASLVLAITFTLSCSGGGGDDGSGDGGGGGGGSGGGRLTVTGLPSGQWTANVYATGTDISNADAYMSAGLSKIEAAGSITNSNVFNLFNKTSLQFWTGSGSRYVALVGSEAADPVNPVYYRYATVNFSNGSATVPFSSFTAVTDLGGGDPGGGDGGGGEGRLTVTELPSDHWLAYVFVAGTDISTEDAIASAIKRVNGTNKVEAISETDTNVFDLLHSSALHQPWTGSGNRPVVLLKSNRNNTSKDGEFYSGTVNFSNKSATVPFSSFTQVTE